MIADNLINMKLYKVPKEVVDFVEQSLISTPQSGKHVLSDNIYVNIEKYNTKSLSEAKFESHKNYIDIQILLSGSENIYYTDINNLDISIPYDENKDIMFYSNSVKPYNNITLNGKTNFVILFPWEAHAPQVSVDENCEEVLKMVVKIKY